MFVMDVGPLKSSLLFTPSNRVKLGFLRGKSFHFTAICFIIYMNLYGGHKVNHDAICSSIMC